MALSISCCLDESLTDLSISFVTHYFLLDTLPPFLQTTTREPSTTETALPQSPYTLSPTYGDLESSYVPIEKRGPELTFAETGQEKTFVFAENNTFIQIDGDIIQTFQLR